jgi:hypothetical protein
VMTSNSLIGKPRRIPVLPLAARREIDEASMRMSSRAGKLLSVHLPTTIIAWQPERESPRRRVPEESRNI